MRKLIALLLLCPLTAFAAVAVDGTASESHTDHYPTEDITSISTTHTAAGSNRYALVCLINRWRILSAPTSISCTYDGVAMSSLGESCGSNVNCVDMFGLSNPNTTASATVSCSWTGSQAISQIGVQTFTGVTVGVGTAGTFTSGSTASPSMNTVSASGNIVQNCIGTSGGKPITAGQTQDWNYQNASDAGGGGGEHANGAASVTTSWTLTAADQVNMMAIDVRSALPATNENWFNFFFNMFPFF